MQNNDNKHGSPENQTRGPPGGGGGKGGNGEIVNTFNAKGRTMLSEGTDPFEEKPSCGQTYMHNLPMCGIVTI